MNSLAFVTALAAVASAGAAGAGVWLASRTFHRGAELQAFLALTVRYEDIMSELPERLTNDWTERDDADLMIRLRYLNLCSDEFYLRKEELLSKKVWRIWEREIRRTLTSRPFSNAWPELQRQFECYPEFKDFVNGVMNAAPGNGGDEIVCPSPSTTRSPLPDLRAASARRLQTEPSARHSTRT